MVLGMCVGSGLVGVPLLPMCGVVQYLSCNSPFCVLHLSLFVARTAWQCSTTEPATPARGQEEANFEIELRV